ncbi:ATP-binding protein [Sporolactobacillus terrae]|uniref:ATP-binding protein n=1 Tax=Sporolactobacillus terrae TaxID=269673 RepID=UPI001118E445|nr:ATP-binding protein [Sporolactobacillus terrae]
MQTIKGLNQQQLYLIVSLVFFTVVSLSVYSVYYMKTCVRQEVQDEANKSKYYKLSEQIVDLNNEKTDEVRKFIATGNMDFFYSYWNVINKINTIHDNMSKVQRDMITQESRYLNTAMEDLTLLSYTDIRSMKLMTDTISVKRDRLPLEINEYVINIEEKKMSKAEKRHQALNLLFDENYINEKNVITNNIMSFRKYVDERLDSQLNKAKIGVQTAIKLQSWLQIFFVVTFIGVLILLYLYNVQPIRSYTNVLTRVKKLNDTYELKPTGSFETKLLAKVFNQLYQSLVKANQAKSEFLSMISHELRTPLNSINGYIFLLKRSQVTMRQKQYLTIIENSSRHLLLLINQILEFGKIEKGKLNISCSEFDIRKVLKSDIDMFAYSSVEKNIKLEFNFSKHIPAYIRSDQRLINQVVINLLSNAVKFTPSGSIDLTVDFIPTNSEMKHGDLVVSITDTGIGINKKSYEKIFQAFEQASPDISIRFGGSGLGLAITKNIVDGMGGKIKVKSDFNSGTTFTVILPVVYVEQSKIEEQKYSIAVNQGNFYGISVLLVEDNLINAKMEYEILSMLGFEVHTAHTGREAMHLIDQRNFPFLFLDIRLPDYSGFQVADYARKSVANSNSHIIALTANIEEVSKIRPKSIHSFLSKPFEIEKLIAIVKSTDQFTLKKQNISNKILNDSRAIQRLMGKTSLYLELLTLFLRDHSEDTCKYHHLFIDRKYKDCEFVIHSLKGVSQSIGAEKLTQTCDQIGKRLKKIQGIGITDKAISQLNEDNRKLHDLFIITKERINAYLKDNNINGKRNVRAIKGKTRLPSPNKMIIALKDKIDKSDGYCYEFIDEHADSIRNSMSSVTYDRLREALYQFDFQKAIQILEKGE